MPIEDGIKEVLKEYIANCLVIGDKRKHLAAILTLRTVLDERNQPTDKLHPDVKEVKYFIKKKIIFNNHILSGLKDLELKLTQLKNSSLRTVPRLNLRLWMESRRSTRKLYLMQPR